MTAPRSISFLFELYVVLLLVVASGQVRADLYKWVDEEGNTHYSDQSPQDREHSTVTTSASPGQQALDKAARLEAINLPYGRTSKKIILGKGIYQWQQSARGRQKIGVYYAGPLCTSRGAMYLAEVEANHPYFLPGENGIPHTLKKTVANLGYDAQVVLPRDLEARMKTLQGIYLKAVITELEMHSCAPVRSTTAAMSPQTISWREFTRNRVSLRVLWQVYSDLAEPPVFETSTTGYVDNWQTSKRSFQAVDQALIIAAGNLFADRRFIDLVTVGASDAPVNRQSATMNPSQDSADQGSLQSLITGGMVSIDEVLADQMIRRSRVARVLGEANTLKIMSVQYFFETDEWPRMKQDLGLSDRLFENHELIAGLQLHRDGDFTLLLRDRIFGPSRVLRMIPNTASYISGSSLNLEWRCASNLSREELPTNCEPM